MEHDTQCPGCGKTSQLFNNHHIVPRSLGGLDSPSNIIKICIECHAKIHIRKNLGNPVLIKEGLAKARARGQVLGCPVKLSLDQIKQIKEMYIRGIAISRIAKDLGISRQTVYRYLAKVTKR